MTDEQINLAIAEACGWTLFVQSLSGIRGVPPNVMVVVPIQIHNYCTDLNAMHEAEKVLNIIEQGHYWDYLKDLTDEGFNQLHATARHRAEAFLRTLGKWEEVQP